MSPSDAVQLHQIEVSYHQAATTQDLSLMMSLFANDANLIVGDKTYSGKDQIRNYFSTIANSFKPGNHWASYTPAYKDRMSAKGDQGTYYFECLYIDQATGQTKAHLYADATLVRSGNGWLIQTLKAGPVAAI